MPLAPLKNQTPPRLQLQSLVGTMPAVPQTQGDQALIIEITDGSEGSNAEKYLNVNRAVAVRESGYIRGAVARDRRV